MLAKVSATVARLGKVPCNSLSPVGAPKQLLTGCEFRMTLRDSSRKGPERSG
jgi:hypothetical protein